MSLQTRNCSICDTYDSCYHACCLVVYLCRSCLMDSDLLASHNECPECYRSLEAIYHSLVNKARFNEAPSRMGQRTLSNNNFRTTQVNQNQVQMRNNFNFQESRQEVEEDFEFAQTLHQKQSQVRKSTNDFTSHLRSNANQYQQENFNHQGKQFHMSGMNNSFVQNKPFQQKTIPGNMPFSPRNNFNSSQFNGKRNNFLENSACYDENPYQPNHGYQHQNEMHMNNGFQQGNSYQAGCGNGGFNQNIRQNRPMNQNNNFQPNRFQNNFMDNSQCQNQQQMNIGTGNKKTNQFPMWNQQKSNKIHQNNFNQQNQVDFQQTKQQDSNSFQFNNNSFQNTQSYERATKSVGKVQQLKRLNNFNGNSGSFKIDNHGNNSNSEKELSPTFGTEFSNENRSNGAIVSFGNQMRGEREKMELEHEDVQQTIKKNKSYDSLVTLGRRDDSSE